MLVESQPLALVAENGGPRLVAYQGRNTDTTRPRPEMTPTSGVPARPARGAERARREGSDGREEAMTPARYRSEPAFVPRW